MKRRRAILMLRSPATRFTQRAWAERQPARPSPDAVATVLSRLRAAPPHSITLVALAPLTSIGAMIVRDPVAFRRLAGVVMMGGSIRRGYGPHAGETSPTPSIEYNVRCDPAGLRALLASGVAVTLMPLDATEIALDATRERRILVAATRVTGPLAALTAQWARNTQRGPTPTLFDVVPVAWLRQPSVCTPVPLRLLVTPAGLIRAMPGPANASACLRVDNRAALRLLEHRLTGR